MAEHQNETAQTEMTWREVVELGVTPAPAELARKEEENEDDHEQAQG